MIKTNPVNPKIKSILVQTSYYIAKAHGGELKVITNHIEGLPAEASNIAKASLDESAKAGS